MVGKLKVSAFQNFFLDWKIRWILRKLWAKNMFCNILSFFWNLWSIIHICHHLRHLRHESNYMAFDPLLRYFTSLTSPTWIQIKGKHCTEQCYSCRRCQRNYCIEIFSHLRITLCIIIQTIQIKKYFDLMLWITWNFELKPWINSNYNYFELDNN